MERKQMDKLDGVDEIKSGPTVEQGCGTSDIIRLTLRLTFLAYCSFLVLARNDLYAVSIDGFSCRHSNLRTVLVSRRRVDFHLRAVS